MAKSKLKLKLDVSYVLPAVGQKQHLSVGLVAGKPGQYPTLFIDAYCNSKADKMFFRRIIKQLTSGKDSVNG